MRRAHVVVPRVANDCRSTSSLLQPVSSLVLPPAATGAPGGDHSAPNVPSHSHQRRTSRAGLPPSGEKSTKQVCLLPGARRKFGTPPWCVCVCAPRAEGWQRRQGREADEGGEAGHEERGQAKERGQAAQADEEAKAAKVEVTRAGIAAAEGKHE